MADAAQIGATASGYEGNAALGGGSFGFGQLDIRPLMDLARYTMLYNRAEYDQRQKDHEAWALEVADAVSYDLTTAIKKDATTLQNKYDELLNFMANNPGATDYKNKELWKKYKEMRNDLDNDLKQAKVRNTLYMARQNEIDAQKDPGLKAKWQKDLDEEVNRTDIRTPLRHTAQFDIDPVEVQPAPIVDIQTTDFGKNFFGQANWKLWDAKRLNQAAASAAYGLDKLVNFEQQEWFLKMTPEQQKQYRDQFATQSASQSGKLEPVMSATNFNAALKQLPESYYNVAADGTKTLNWDKVKSSDNSLISGIVQQAEIFNQSMDQMTDWIKQGYFKDNFGGVLHFGNDASGLKESDYKKINLDDGLSPEELIKMRMMAVTPSPERKIKVEQTNIDLRQQEIGLKWAELGLERDKFKFGTSQQILGADAILKEVTDAISMAVPKQLRSTTRGTTDVLEIADPNLLKEFGTIDKDGNIVNRPDLVLYNPQTNQLSLTYYKKKAVMGKVDDKEKITGYENSVDKNNNPIVDRQVGLNPTEWFGQIARRKFSTDDAGAINNFVDQIYSKFNRNLLNLTQGYRGGATTTTGQTTTTESDAQYYQRTGKFRTKE